MPPFNIYRYDALHAEDAVRLITLEPATDEKDPLSCSITQVRRSALAVGYYAISYTWGKIELSRTLEVRDDSDTSYLRITPNVDAVLRRLRALEEPHRTLWIDAVCLNQKDEVEKAQQIPLMGRIFGEATGVHIWLGPEDPAIPKLFKFFTKASQLPEIEKEKMATRIARLFRKIFGGGDGLRGLRRFYEFSNRPWFSRRWIIQEACLAQQATLHCGNLSIPLQTLVRCAARFQSLDLSSYPIKAMANLRRPTAKLTMLEPLWNFHEAGCLDRKDRIAALYGLLPDEHRFPLNYALHWTELYREVAYGVLGHGGSNIGLQLMAHLMEFGPVSKPEDDVLYPSWIPDWSKTRRRVLPYHTPIRNTDTYEAYPTSPGTSGRAVITFQDNLLQVHWDSSAGGPRGWEVAYVARLDSADMDREQRAGRVGTILRELLPRSRDSRRRVLAVASLLGMAVKFRQESEDRDPMSLALDMHLQSITGSLPTLASADASRSLRSLYTLLQELCIFEFKSAGWSCADAGGYGLCSQQVRAGDTLVPLWNVTWRRGRYKNFQDDGHDDEKGLRMTTMLVIRRAADEGYLAETAAIPPEKTKKPPANAGRIVGWAVCVLVERGWDYGWLLSLGARSLATMSGRRRCSMHIV